MSRDESPEPAVGAVAIGRNEGERLQACLRSLVDAVGAVVYVDSGSTDGSVAFARSLGVEVVELDLSRPFSMPRARNTGWKRLLELHPDLAYVQFVDGDCRLEPGWIDAAVKVLKADEQAAVVCGRRMEIHPEHSRYNRFCDIEWNTPVGESSSSGGDFLVRADVLRDSGGMNESLIAGEEPEWCLRLRKRGWRIMRIDAPMTQHDAAILRFGQWWKRNRRGGYGALDAWLRCRQEFPDPAGTEIPFDHLLKSSRSWVRRIAAAMVAGLVVGGLAVGLVSDSVAGGVLGGVTGGIGAAGALVVFQAGRIAGTVRERHPSGRVRLSYGLFTMVAKLAQVLGQRDCRKDRRRGREARLIEYKDNPGTGSEWEAWRADRARCGPSAFFREPSLWALWLYRFGRWNAARRPGLTRWLLDRFYWTGYRLVGTFTGIGIDRLVAIGPGLRIHHFGNIFLHSRVRIGRNCTLRQGVTIGNRADDGPVPTLGDDVECGAYAQVLGGIQIGDGAKIGALSVVLQDVPPGHTAVGIPARIIPAKEKAKSDGDKTG